MEHLLHRLYGVDAPVNSRSKTIFYFKVEHNRLSDQWRREREGGVYAVLMPDLDVPVSGTAEEHVTVEWRPLHCVHRTLRQPQSGPWLMHLTTSYDMIRCERRV